MEHYDYAEAVRNDCEQRIEEIINRDEFEQYNIDVQDYDSFEEFKEALSDKLVDGFCTDDGITGSASGSYTCNANLAEEYLCHNLDLLADVCEEYGMENVGEIIRSAETADTLIRDYMVHQELGNAIDNMEEELEQYYDEKTAEKGMEIE